MFATTRIIIVFLFIASLASADTPVKGEKTTAPEVIAKTKTKAFKGEALKIHKWFKDLFVASKFVNGKGSKANRIKIALALDWNRISRDCLGPTNWKKNPKGRVTFQALLKEIILLTAYKRMPDFWKGATYEFEKIDVKGTKGHVGVNFIASEDSYLLEYYLLKSKNKWRITDLAVEGIRYSESINEQIEYFLREKKFRELLKRLRKRRNELRS